MTQPNPTTTAGSPSRTYTTDAPNLSVQIHDRYVCLLIPFTLDDGTTATLTLQRTPGQTRELTRRLTAHANYATPAACLYCGDTDEIFETRITVDDRTDEYALQCGNCGGVWTE